MNADQLMHELERLGTAQNRKVYARHGAPANQFGVSFAHLTRLKKEIRQDQALADALWASGNADARILACMIADPASFDRRKLDAWVGAIGHYVLCDSFAGNVAARSEHATAVAEAWTGSSREFTAAAGWDVVASLAMQGAAEPRWMKAQLARIARDIRGAPNRARHAMNMALIAIGGTHADLEGEALALAARIGKVEVDHGETGCKTPDAAGYIARMAARRARAAGGGKKTVRARA